MNFSQAFFNDVVWLLLIIFWNFLLTKKQPESRECRQFLPQKFNEHEIWNFPIIIKNFEASLPPACKEFCHCCVLITILFCSTLISFYHYPLCLWLFIVVRGTKRFSSSLCHVFKSMLLNAHFSNNGSTTSILLLRISRNKVLSIR